MKLTELLDEADSLLGSTVRMWPLGMPCYDGKLDGISTPSADKLYKMVIERTTDETLLHRAHLGLGEFYADLCRKMMTPEGSQENAYTHTKKAYTLAPGDDESRYMFSFVCHAQRKDEEAPVKYDSQEGERLRKLVGAKLNERWRLDSSGDKKEVKQEKQQTKETVGTGNKTLWRRLYNLFY